MSRLPAIDMNISWLYHLPTPDYWLVNLEDKIVKYTHPLKDALSLLNLLSSFLRYIELCLRDIMKMYTPVDYSVPLSGPVSQDIINGVTSLRVSKY